ncbi:hypothetical protein SPRG_03634 [Saprolegnia parasitica CBS 223.65]|uniref:Carbohydrate-binding domain-containing protein n=1 Tax=Saprolegnia parasitica (strain CBS 223.65) TaxID=695850 RepID=A0A067CYZ2_SAPPC|nr:hypothetical protein SPRG_03634 [Saprolegnia parasitica CBS 223.65]KDO31716.1 hypothetical protein SPRG_03634 [Saprolegnia parasitica CBS 223.65]|eukprot:XP_012197599.1 hypothetical protein SPRG_03634 [Saprolegnia parasitica CBS 223.65]
MYGTYALEVHGQALRRLGRRHRVYLCIAIAALYSLAMVVRIDRTLRATSLDVSAGPYGCLPVPSLSVAACPTRSVIAIGERVVNRAPYAGTTVALCYTNTTIELTFSATQQDTFFVQPTYGHNDNIWEYNVMETFLALGDDDPTSYFEFEVSPTNQTYSAFILNPRRDFSPPVGHFYVGKDEAEARALGITATTSMYETNKTWTSDVSLPLNLFNVVNPKGSVWRMNFLRKITSPATFPQLACGAWNAPNQDNFHLTSCFGRVRFD